MPDPSTAVRRRLLATLVASTGLSRTAVIAALTVVTIAAEDITGSKALAGIPAAAATIGLALATRPTAALMVRFGRRPGIALGQLTTAVGAMTAIAAVTMETYALLVAAMAVFGAGTAADRMSRYAAADIAEPSRKASAIALVVWAGVIGSVGGPLLLEPTRWAAAAVGAEELAGPFALAVLASVGAAIVIALFLRPDPLDVAAEMAASAPQAVSPGADLRQRHVITAIVALAVGQFVMVEIMTMTPVYMREATDTLGTVGLVIGGHTFGMFALSPFTGWLADRYGRLPVLLAGQALLVGSGILAATAGEDQLVILLPALFLLGVGWNAGFVAGSALLMTGLHGAEAVRLQGIADTITWTAGAAASFSSGFLLDAGGYPAVGLIGATLAVVPLVVTTRHRMVAGAI
ncbi:MAG TPA: MFS transporter [Acidimicrobiia bacterium]|nr:MFS transporter [Acidimicrobiia bacterium]